MAVLVHPSPAWAAVATAPLGLSATAGNAQATLLWNAPTSDGGFSVSDYIVEYSPDSGITYYRFFDAVQATPRTATVTGLTNGIAYLFRVSAVNSAGTGPVSATASATPFVVHTANDPATYAACPPGIAPAPGFTDTAALTLTTQADIDCVAYYEVTKGTTATTYSPYDPVTRLQMALFLTRMAGPAGITLGDGTGHGFTDISAESEEFRTAIGQIKQLGITTGKTATTYAPADLVTREEMALFISRFLTKATAGKGGNTEYVSGTSGPVELKSNDADHNFTDLNLLALWESQTAIINLWNLGVTDVQSFATYEPNVPMTRTSMATFIARALDHTNARPAGLVIQASSYRAQGTPYISFSVSHRDADFNPIAGTRVDTFKFTHTVVTTTTRFAAATGRCLNTVRTGTGSTMCTIDSSDPVTDSSGNLAIFADVVPVVSQQDFWAWTAATGTIYDNDDHAAGASLITVESYP